MPVTASAVNGRRVPHDRAGEGSVVVVIRYPPWDPKAGLIMCIGCPYCRDDDPDVACDCPCHEEERSNEEDG